MTFSPTDKPYFCPSALAHLPAAQQALFEQWGRGPDAQPGYGCIHQLSKRRRHWRLRPLLR